MISGQFPNGPAIVFEVRLTLFAEARVIGRDNVMAIEKTLETASNLRDEEGSPSSMRIVGAFFAPAPDKKITSPSTLAVRLNYLLRYVYLSLLHVRSVR
jgi:hypothetical protein